MAIFFLNPSFELTCLNVKFLLIKKSLALKHASIKNDLIQYETFPKMLQS